MPDRITRRRLLRQAAVAGAGAAGLGLARDVFGAAGGAPRPNFLFIFTDDQRWDAMSCMGHPFLRTPGIDRIANEGARFANAFVVDSLCSPSRACFLTGTYPHIHGVTMNDIRDYDTKLPTYATVLQQAGYDTGFVGKWHQDGRNSNPRPGFNYWLSFRGHGQYNDCELNENGRAFKSQGYITDQLTDYAVQFLRRPRTAPFCMALAHKAPHDPRTPAERHKNALADARFAKPESFDEDFHDKPAFLRRGGRAAAGAPVPDRLPPAVWNPANPGWINHYRTLLAVDEGVQRILKTLEETGQLDNTVIVYSSDNGYFFGEHRRGDKRLMYEEALRIPLLVRYPRLLRPGTVINEMALNIDIAPTFIDLGGATVPATMQGRSLRPLMAGEKGEWRHSFFYEYFVEAPFRATPTCLGVRTEQYSYMTYPEIQEIDELYDIRKDPHQLHNLAQDPAQAGVVAQMRAEMERLKQETHYRPMRDPRLDTMPAGPAKRSNAYVLLFDFAKNAKTTDASGQGNNGTGRGVSTADGRNGAKALRFDGTGGIDVPKSPSLDPSRGAWSVEAVVKPEQPDGVILAHGGQSLGYSLYLAGGRPTFTVKTSAGAVTVSGKQAITGQWTRLAAVIGADLRVTLYVNGQSVGQRTLAEFIERSPNEGMQVGQDSGTPVTEYARPRGFTGLMESVRVFSGERSAAEIAKEG